MRTKKIPIGLFCLLFSLLPVALGAEKKNRLSEVITLEFRNAPLVDVVNSIADSAKINVVISPQIALSNASVSIRLKNVTYEVGLKTILNIYGLSSVLENGILRIDSVQNFAAERKLKESEKASLQRAEPPRTMIWQIAYAKSEEMLATLSKLTEDIKLVDPRFQVEADKRTNKLIISGTAAALRKTKTILLELDKPKRQIQIQARVVEASTEVAKTLQTNLGTRLALDASRGYGVGIPFPNSLVTGLGGAGALGSASPQAGAANGATQNGELAFSFSSINNLVNLDMILKAYETESMAQVVAEPRIVVQDQETATLSDVQSSSRFTFVNGAASNATISSDLNLSVKPQLAGENVVQLDINVSRSSPTGPNSSSATGTATRTANTKVFLNNGETTIIGGMYQTQRYKSKGQIPFLGSIPFIGWLFRLNDELSKKTELLIMVTPRILNDEISAINVDEAGKNGKLSKIEMDTPVSNGSGASIEPDVPTPENAGTDDPIPPITSDP